jgi:hypothetical protein
MMRITLDSPALVAIQNWLAGSTAYRTPRFGRGGRRTASRTKFRAEQLEPRMMLDAGMRALLPDLVASSDTGFSQSDNLTADRTPTLTGSVRGAVSQVRLFIDGQRGDLLPVVNGAWTHTVPAEEALAAGKHTIAVRPFSPSGQVGTLSKPLTVTIMVKQPTPPTLGIAAASDTGTKGDGKTIVAEPIVRGVAPRGRFPSVFVNVSIDDVPVGRVKAHPVTGAWSLKSPRLANGEHTVTAVAECNAGNQSVATSSSFIVEGPRTVMLDSSNGQTVELMASHLLGQGSQGFIVTKVHGGTLQKWLPAQNAWKTIPTGAALAANVRNQTTAPIRTISFTDLVRWTPSSNARGIGAAFDVIPFDKGGGAIAPAPQAGTVPGRLVTPRVIADDGVGTTVSWGTPTDGCGCPSTRYSIEVTRQDGRTLLYNLANTINRLAVVEGGRVEYATMWAATKSGAGEARSYDALLQQVTKNRIRYTALNGLSTIDLGTRARAQLASSPTGVSNDQTSFVLGGTHADLAYLEVQAVPDAVEAAQGLPAGTAPLLSSDANRLTPQQKAELRENPILAGYLFPGTVNGDVQPDQVRAHFQAGETLRFAGTVDARVRAGATIVVEKAQNLGDGSLGPWFEEARIPIGADGSFSHKYLVPYGLNSVRVRLEYRTQPAAASVGATSSTSTPISTPIDLSTSFNAFGITTPPWQVGNSQGFDGNGNYYNSDYTGPGTSDPIPGTPIIYNGISFPIGPVPTNSNQVGGTEGPRNFVRATGQTIPVSVDADKSDYLYLAGAASNGNQLSQDITLTFTDGTTETWTQSFHDWASDGPPQSSNPPWPPASMTAPGANSKFPVRVATTTSLQNTNPSPTTETFSGLQTIDGVVLVEGDRVLVKNQTNEQYNGIYIASAGTWSRAKDALTPEQQWNATVSVLSGTTNGGKYFWENTSPFASSILQAKAAELRENIQQYERELIRFEMTASPREIEQLRNRIAGYVKELETTEAKLAKLIALEYPITFVETAAPVPTPRPFAGELNLQTEPERINQLGDLVTTPAHIFGYCRNLHGKQLASFTLPNNPNVGILSAVVSKAPVIALDEGFESIVLGTTHLTGVDVVALTIANESNIGAGGGPLTFSFADQPEKGSTTSPLTYTTKEVVVPMGQQTTIAYIAPDSSSQMTFSVQKSDGTCVGTTCSTYLTDWADGSGSSVNWAANLSPSLNSQIEAGQHWTMTIQNAGLGYNGYLSSPSGKKLPAGGAQFKLMTQNEMNDQPPWAVALEKIGGEAIALVGITILTAGTGDAAVLEEESTELLLKEGENGTEIGSQGGKGESVRSDGLPDNLISDADITVEQDSGFLMNLSDEYLSESSIVQRDSINDIKDRGFDRDAYDRWLARGAGRRVV